MESQITIDVRPANISLIFIPLISSSISFIKQTANNSRTVCIYNISFLCSVGDVLGKTGFLTMSFGFLSFAFFIISNNPLREKSEVS